MTVTTTELISLSNPISQLCAEAQFEEPAFARWIGELAIERRYWRKQWEFAYICQALENAGLLTDGRTALGFGVGQEPLPALFAAYGIHVTATDQHTGGAWAASGQFSAGAFDLPYRGICDRETFRRLVAHEPADMNDIPKHLRRCKFDFIWSANSLDHLGSIEAGLAFVRASMDCLKPGGTAVHTTEFNLDSNDETLSHGGVVLFRECDIERLAEQLRRDGHHIEIDLTPGSGPRDLAVDKPPYSFDPHIRLEVGGYTTTSIGLIIKRGAL
jgi:hypothetical protein